MKLLVIEVLGVPQVPLHDRMVDQLKIHFLKRSNSGGDVLTVIYPTSTPGQAYVIFESDKVPGILEATHILDVNNTFYPIRVKKADLSEVDMPVETTLRLSIFPNRESVRKLLESCDFTITEDIPGRLQLKGSFLKLKLVRSQLIQLFGPEHHHSTPSSDLPNGSSLGYVLERTHLNSRFVSKSRSRNVPDSGSSGSSRIPQGCHSFYDGRNASGPVDAVAEEYQKQDKNEHLFAYPWSTRYDGASSITANDPSNLNLLQHTSYRDSASGGFPRNPHFSTRSTSHAADTTYTHHTSHEDSHSGGSLRRPSSSDDSPSSSSGGISSFQVDNDIINFIQTRQNNHMQKIRKDYGTKMVVQGDAEVATVTFSGKNSEKAKACLLSVIKEVSPSLRTQEIHLENYDLVKQMQIRERIQRNQEPGVMITLHDDVVKLVGSSRESFEMMLKILGCKDDRSRGRTMEKGSIVRRSSSLPKQYKMTQQSRSTDPEPCASGTRNKYNPSRYQEKQDEGKTPQIGRGSERTHSNAQFQALTVEQRVHQDMDLTSASPGKKSKRSSLKKIIGSGMQLLPIKKKDFHTKKQNQN